MNDIQKLRLEFLNETIEYYSKHPRCVKDASCRYDSRSLGIKGTTGCAIGRKCSPELRKELDEIGGSVRKFKIYDKLPMKLKLMGNVFLELIQQLHDVYEYWDGKNLSKAGLEHVNDIRKKYNL